MPATVVITPLVTVVFRKDSIRAGVMVRSATQDFRPFCLVYAEVVMAPRLHVPPKIVGLIAILSIAFLSWSSCTPNLVPSVKDMHLPESGLPEAVRRSSVILIGQVSSVRITKRVPETPDKKWWVLLVKAEASVENVLKGEVRGRNITFYYYYPEYGGHFKSLNLIGPYVRAIFFLERDQGVYRSVNDVYSSCIHLTTGSHPGLSVGPHKTVEQAITEACILPGSERHLGRERWPSGIEQGAKVGEQLIGPQETVKLLNSLQNDPDYRVRAEACLAAANLLPTKHPCLDQLQIDLGFNTSFHFDVRWELAPLLARYHYELGGPLPVLVWVSSRPGGPMGVRFYMKKVKVWWPW